MERARSARVTARRPRSATTPDGPSLERYINEVTLRQTQRVKRGSVEKLESVSIALHPRCASAAV